MSWKLNLPPDIVDLQLGPVPLISCERVLGVLTSRIHGSHYTPWEEGLVLLECIWALSKPCMHYSVDRGFEVQLTEGFACQSYPCPGRALRDRLSMRLGV